MDSAEMRTNTVAGLIQVRGKLVQLRQQEVLLSQLTIQSDYGCVTLLLADPTPNALQVQTKSGDWITANPMRGAFVVNIGDMMERWTNGIWKSTNHRVIHRGEKFRVSVPFFFEPNFDAEVRPLRKCVQDTGGNKLYDSVIYGDHLGRKIESNFY